MTHPGTAVDFTELFAFFRTVDGKIESLLKDPEAPGSSRMIQEIEELKSAQKDLRARLDKIINMFLMTRGNDNHLDVYAVSQEGLTIVRSTVQWFTQKQQEMEARADHLLDLKAAVPRKPAGIKLGGTAADFPGGSDKPNTESSVFTLKEASAGKISTSVSEIEEVAESSDEDPDSRRATVPVGDLFVPRKRLADRLNLTEVSDDGWKLVEGILAESTEFSIELSLSVVELYIQLLPRDNEGMSMVYDFVETLNGLASENTNRDVVKWILHVVKVADEEFGQLVASAGQPGKSTAEEVEDLLGKFMAVITALENVNNFSSLPECVRSVIEAVESLKTELKDIKKDTEGIKKYMEERRIRLKYGLVAPLIIWIVNHIGMCFKRWFYRGKLR